eukprot:1159591-Pyramimonas_sp.AAC.2
MRCLRAGITTVVFPSMFAQISWNWRPEDGYIDMAMAKYGSNGYVSVGFQDVNHNTTIGRNDMGMADYIVASNNW